MREIKAFLLCAVILVIGCSNDPLTKSLDKLDTSLVLLGASITILQVSTHRLENRVACLTQPIAYCEE